MTADGDGVPNIQEYVFGSNPLSADPRDETPVRISQSTNPNTLLVSYRRRTDDWRIAYYLQTSTSFADWQTTDPSLIVNEASSTISPGAEWLTQEVMVINSVPQFFRVKVLFLVPE